MMQTVIDVRMMAEADIPAVLEIQAICYTELTPESDASLHAKLRASQSTCFIASLGGEAVGYLIALPWEFSSPPVLNAATCRLPPSPDCLYLHDLAVSPRARKFGTGRALVEAFLARLRASGLGRASLVAVQDSAPYWERYGFRAVPLSVPLEAKLATYGERVAYMALSTWKAPDTSVPSGTHSKIIMTTTQPTKLDTAHFDSKARQWDENPVFRERGLKIAEAVRKAVPLHRRMRALDYGCGTGLLSFPLRDELGAILMADSSGGMLEVVAEKIAAQGVGNMTPVKLDLLIDPPPAQHFDLIVTAMTLHHVPDTDRILRIFHALLQPGGHLCIADLDKEDGSFHGPEIDVHHGFDRDDLRQRAARAGFADVQFQTVFSIAREHETGTRDYPVFLMTARRAGT